MPVQSKTTLKGYFNTGDKPTEAQFADLIDSFFTPIVATQTASFTISDTSGVSLCNAFNDSGFTATLPTAASASGTTYKIKKTDASVNPVKIIGTSGQTIDGFAYIFLYNQNDFVEVTSDGTNWRITG
ncbi:hypothetical protein CCP1ISM_20044 [Azospirillaceae bacterium]